MSDETRKIEVIMNGQKANASIKEMKASAKLLWNQLQKLEPESKAFINKSKEFQKVSQRLGSVHKEARGVSKGFQILQMSATQFLGVFSGFAIIQKIGQLFTDTISKSKEFQSSLSELQSITGASAEDMEFYNDEARLMGAITTKSATEVAQAFTIIGSKKPELLKSKESLAEVTKETIALAEAAKISIPEAADALSQALNKFDLPASESARVVNVLAESYRKGSVDIGKTAFELSKFGGIAKEQGLSVEQSAAAIQVVGKTVNESGVKIRNILLQLAEGANETNPAVVGLETALDNLAKGFADGTMSASDFGTQNTEGALMMVKNRDQIKKMTAEITGTSAAYEMAAINTDNYEAAQARLDSAITDVQLGLGKGLIPVLRFLAENFAILLLSLKELPRFLKENWDLFAALGVALVTFNSTQIIATASTIAMTVAEKGRAIATRASAIAQTFLNAAMTANPIGLVLKAVALLGAGFLILYNRSETVRGGIAGIWEAMKQLGSNMKDIASAFLTGDPTALFSAFKNIGNGVGESFTQGYEEKLDAEKVMQEEQEGVVAAVKEGNKQLNEEEKAAQAAAKALEDKKQLARQQALEEANKKRLAAQRTLEDLRHELIEDSYERERTKAATKFEREIEDLDKNAETYLERKLLIEENKKLVLDELKAKQKEEDEAKKLEEYELMLEEEELAKEKELVQIENAFITAVDAEQAKEEAIYKVQQQYAQKRYDLMVAMHGKDSIQALKASNALLNIEKNRTKDLLANEQAFENAKRELRELGHQAVVDIFHAGLALMDEDSKLRKATAKALKAYTIGKMLIDAQQEIAAVWKNNNSSPINIVAPGYGAIKSIAETASVVARTAVGIKQVRAQKFALGGATVPMVEVDGVWQQARNAGSFSPGGMVSGTNLGVIGEKGPEWVAPNWMLQRPDTANVIGMLEATRKGRAFAQGGSTSIGQESPINMMGTDMRALEQKLDLNNQLLIQLNQNVTAWPATLKVMNSLQEVEDGLRTLQTIRDDASVS